MPFDQTKTSLANVIVKLETLPKLSSTRRRDLISAISRTAKFLNRAPSDLPTDAPALREILATIHPVQAGISAKSLANVKSNLTKALQLTRAMPRELPIVEQTVAWTAYLKCAVSKEQRYGLSRFVGYCCSRNIEPDEVTDKVMQEFQCYLDERLLGKDPAQLCKEMRWTWNSIVRRHALPLVTLATPPNPNYRCRPLSIYPSSLQTEIAAYLERRGKVDLFDPDSPDRELRPTSLRNTEAHLRQFLDALVDAGEDPAKLTCLAEVVGDTFMRIAFKAHSARTGVLVRGGALQNIAATLVVVARDYLHLDQSELDAMLRVKKKVSTDPVGMTAKNIKRLMQFNDWENVARLVCLPNELMKCANSGPTTRDKALCAMHAVALTILLSCPMRVANLASLDMERHLVPYRTGKHTRYSIRIEGADVKNRQPIDVQLSGPHSAILHKYITTFRKHLSNTQSTALFPQKGNGEPRAPSNLSAEIFQRIYREIGLTVNVHLFRHLAAKIYLDANPGHYENVRRLLKHKNIQTTINFYAELSSQHAHDSYANILKKFGGGNV